MGYELNDGDCEKDRRVSNVKQSKKEGERIVVGALIPILSIKFIICSIREVLNLIYVYVIYHVLCSNIALGQEVRYED